MGSGQKKGGGSTGFHVSLSACAVPSSGGLPRAPSLRFWILAPKLSVRASRVQRMKWTLELTRKSLLSMRELLGRVGFGEDLTSRSFDPVSPPLGQTPRSLARCVGAELFGSGAVERGQAGAAARSVHHAGATQLLVGHALRDSLYRCHAPGGQPLGLSALRAASAAGHLGSRNLGGSLPELCRFGTSFGRARLLRI